VRKILAAWLSVTIGMVGLMVTQEGRVSKSAHTTASAKRFVELLAKNDFATAVKDFDETMTRVMPPEKLQEVWASLLAKTGPLKKQVSVRTAKVPKFEIVLVTCEFEKATLDVKVVFDAAGKITGLWFAPVQPAVEYQAPAYVKRDSFEEREVQVGSEPWVLPGTLSLPKGDGPFPGVVLVHGSGPHDRDETIGPNKPFRDLAWGLASRGIAVLRYEKRTKSHGLKMVAIKDSLTVKEETIDDALAAVSVLRDTETIDASRIYVLGHSLGGMLAPRMAALDRRIAGLIILAGNTRPLEDLFLDQRRWLFSLDGEVSEDEKATLQELEEQVARVKSPELSGETPPETLPSGISAAYWLALRRYDPPAVAKHVKQPMLILQGGRDYQVTMDDYRGWQEALSLRSDVVLKVYPECNHLFIEGEGTSTPAEYQVPGHVAEVVIEDIANWITKGRTRLADRRHSPGHVGCVLARTPSVF